jgi:adenylate kinase
VSAPSQLFARFGLPARIKLLTFGSTGSETEVLANQLRSLNLEHVSPATLPVAEISRRPATAVVTEAAAVARLRRWFFARKPDAGFVLSDFPATLLQALLLDEWLDARGEALNGVIAGAGADPSVVVHYRTLGLLMEANQLVA